MHNKLQKAKGRMGNWIYKIGKTADSRLARLIFLCGKINHCKNMKNVSLILIVLVVLFSFSCDRKVSEPLSRKESADNAKLASLGEHKHLYLDVHNLEPGKVTFEAVAGAHQKDLATQDKYGVSFVKYWVDEAAGKVYCLAESPDSVSIYKAHKEAHGLVPDLVQRVSDGQEGMMAGHRTLYLDVHRFGPGKVTAEDVANAHAKDLAVQSKYGVNLINYWFDEKTGVVMCLAEADDSTSLINTHKEAHGLIPDEVHQVKQGE
jgi:Nickel responsive protein SCO4226-like